jgi:hypothetical protein
MDNHRTRTLKSLCLLRDFGFKSRQEPTQMKAFALEAQTGPSKPTQELPNNLTHSQIEANKHFAPCA